VFDNVIASTIFTGSGNRWNDRNLGQTPELYNIIFADETNRQKLLEQVSELRRTWLDWEHRIQPMTDIWFDKLEAEINNKTAIDLFPDTAFNSNAATGDSYILSGVEDDEHNPISSTDTLKNYIQGRNETLETEAP